MRPLLILLLLAGCAPAPPPPDDDDLVLDDDDLVLDDDDSSGDPWDALRQAIDASDLRDVTLLIGTADGVVFSYSKGESDPDKNYLLASASKWLSAMTLLSLVDDGVLALDTSFQQQLDWWATDPADPRSEVTLEELMAFTSGFEGGVTGVPCVEDGSTTLDACAQAIHDGLFAFTPGSTFYYGPSHLQIAAAAASSAEGLRWNAVFRRQVGDPLGLAATTGFGLPSLENPRAAGGGTASASDYGAVLTALVAGDLLEPGTVEGMGRDHTPPPVVLAEVPEAAADGHEWHYAQGCWRECDDAPYGPSCDEPGVLSSPGAFGFYPWWDTARGVWGVLATTLLPAQGGARVTVPIGQGWRRLAEDAIGG